MSDSFVERNSRAGSPPIRRTIGSRRSMRRDHGQASVELIAALPIIALLALAAWQLAVAGHDWWRLTEAARVAAREVHVGRQRGDDRAAVKRANEMVQAVSRSARLTVADDGTVRLVDRVGLVGPFRVVGADRAPRMDVASRFAR